MSQSLKSMSYELEEVEKLVNSQANHQTRVNVFNHFNKEVLSDKFVTSYHLKYLSDRLCFDMWAIMRRTTYFPVCDEIRLCIDQNAN